MFKNNLLIAVRNLRRNRAYSFINTLGLSLGIACCLLIFALISYHLSFDKFHHDRENIYRVVTEWHDESIDRSQAVPTPLGKAFRQDLPFAEVAAREVAYPNVLVSIPGNTEVAKFNEPKGVAYAEPEFFRLFNFPLESGNPGEVLNKPDEALITQRLAVKYFGNTGSAMGRTIRVDNKTNFVIRGILKDIPANTDRKQEIYLSYANLRDQSAQLAGDSSWGSVYSGSMLFVRLKHGVTEAAVNNGLKSIVKKYSSGRDAKTVVYRLQPLSDIHFNSDFDGYVNRKYLWALGLIGLFLIVTACVNFVNLATAQAMNRSREIGVRKVLGGLRGQLFWQFISETAVIAVFSAILACAVAQTALPLLNRLFKEEITLHLFTNLPLLICLVTVTVVVIFLAGSYPGLVLSGFRPALALKSAISQQHVGGFSLRRALVITQFAISQMLIIGTLVIASQIHYSRTSELGFTKEGVLMLPVPVKDSTKMHLLRARLEATPGVSSVALCFQAPAADAVRSTNLRFANRPEDEHWSVSVKAGDENYLGTFGIPLVAGRNIFASDTIRECLVNEKFVQNLGIRSARDVIGKQIRIGSRHAVVTGVMKDFYTSSFYESIMPVCVLQRSNDYNNIAVRGNMAGIRSLLPAIAHVWNQTYPEYLYSYQFVDEKIAAFYELDTIMLRLIEGFAAIAVLIGCLGLYGLVSFMAVRKKREIGVRKVLGASSPGIVWLFGKEFSRLLLIAFAFAAPVAWYVMHRYLEQFTYRITIGPGLFLAAIGSTFVIAALTVSYRSIRSALENPVKNLRTE